MVIIPVLSSKTIAKFTVLFCSSIRVEELEITDSGGPNVTNRRAPYIHELCCLMPIDQVAQHLKLDWKTVKEIDKTFLEEKFNKTDYTNSGYIAIDEVSVGKHHKYMTVVLDFITGCVIWCGKNRQTITLDDFFKNMPQKDPLNIKAVTMDMWDPYIKSIKKWCPQAVIVFDKFHIIVKFNKVIDQVRRNEQNRKDLNKVEKILAINENLYKVYILKVELKLIWNAKTAKEMTEALDNWCY